MDSSIIKEIDRQISYTQETLALSTGLRDKIINLESQRNEALNKCKLLEAKIGRLKEEKCSNCTILLNKLNKERMVRDRLKKEEKAKLLRTIAKTLESMEDGATNQMTNAQQIFTQLVCDGFDSNGDNKKVELIEYKDSSDDDSVKEFADCAVIAIESEDSSNDCNPIFRLPTAPVVVPETELQGSWKHNVKQLNRLVEHGNTMKKGRIIVEKDCEIQQMAKKPKCAELLPPVIARSTAIRQPAPSSLKMHPEASPSILVTDTTDTSGATGVISEPKEQSSMWKMKPSIQVDSNIGAASSKRLKQMTLSLSRPEKKHDISLSGGFKGGVTLDHILLSDEEKDVVLPSPERALNKFYSKKAATCETLDDPDQTIFQPCVTSTCNPLETSFDKVPEPSESPTYKYRRDTVRKREKRMKLPGQDCDECAEYYKAAGLGKPQELKARMNVCSRHRDKYQLRAHTPPGFWDPVLPVTPEGSQEGS